MTITLISQSAAQARPQEPQILNLANDADPLGLDVQGVKRIDLHFPKFNDGCAFTQAFLLRRRLGFTGDIRATGDVLIDQLQQMQRSGFTQAVLRADQDFEQGQQQLARYFDFYQGDVRNRPRFATAIAA